MIVTVTKPVMRSVEVHSMGLQGPPGPAGPQGDPAILVPQPIKSISQPAYTVVEANDAWYFIVCNTAAAATEILLPAGVTPGVHFDFGRKGANDLSFYVSTGTLNGKAAGTRIKVRADYSVVGAMLIIPGEWILVGDLA